MPDTTVLTYEITVETPLADVADRIIRRLLGNDSRITGVEPVAAPSEDLPPVGPHFAAAFLIEIEDEGDVSRYIFTDPEWAEWLRSYEPAIPDGQSHITLTVDNIPKSMADAIRALPEDFKEDRDISDISDDALADLTSGSYADDKIHFVTMAAQELDSVNDLRHYEIIGQFATIAY